MSDHFSTVSLRQLTAQILNTEKRGTIFGIYKSRFFRPKPNLSMSIFGQTIDTPIGVAAGPHTQMAQNIITAWLCGARYIELKTVQTLDEIKVSKPCIDMQDEGYNCEWSQELKIEESFREYLKAWILIHLLHHKFGRKTPLNTIFNMSVGYDMAGILNDNVQWFFSKMAGCSAEKRAMIKLDREDLSSEGQKVKIKAAYKKMAKVHHPDIGGDAEKFRQLSDAHKQMLMWAENPQYTSRKALEDCWSYDGATNRWSPPL